MAAYYTKDAWKKCYEYVLQPVNGKKLWPRTGTEVVLPPPVRVMPGRPKKLRKKDPHKESKHPHKILRYGRHMTYQVCFKTSHNKQGCPNKSDSSTTDPPPKRPRGRPNKNQIITTKRKKFTSQFHAFLF